jgi:hypothetical protein
LLDAAERQWAPPTDPVFRLLHPRCEEHIHSVYVQLGSPEVVFHSFWDLYNEMRGAVDSDLLCRYGSGEVDSEERFLSDAPEDSGPPLQHLNPCEFGRNGVPAVQYERE